MRTVSIRASVAWITIGLTIITLVSILGTILWHWRYGLHVDNEVEAVNTVVAVDAYALVAVGLIVALSAYLAASGSPDLYPEIQFRFSPLNEPTFQAGSDPKSPGRSTVVNFRQTEGEVVIRNRSKYAARNPGIRISFVGCGDLSPQQGWEITGQANMIGITGLQWDGGTDYIIHGRWSRRLPKLDFSNLTTSMNDPHMVVDIAADGYGPKQWRIPIRMMCDTQ